MKKKIIIVVLILLAIAAIYACNKYSAIFSKNMASSEEVVLYIPTGSTFDDLVENLRHNQVLANVDAFVETANLKKFSVVKSGRYVLDPEMNNNQLINKLRIGDQDAVTVTFNNARRIENVAGKIAVYLELDSIDILEAMQNPETIQHYGFNKATYPSLFLPNSYEMNWDISAQDLIARFAREYKSFWTDARKEKARALGLSQSEVATLASIVRAETVKDEERKKVAGLYINRLKKGMLLQSDPTLIFAHNDYSIRRVLNKHKEIDSPYNTYKYAGLPPGPINVPSPAYLDAVLDFEKHDYIFMCAKPDFSGFHNFSKTNAQHERYAREYRRALDKAGIYR